MLLDDEDEDDNENNHLDLNFNNMEFEHNLENKNNKPKLNISKMVQMSLIHDIAESIVGDITPFDGITEQQKHDREFDAMKYLGKIFILLILFIDYFFCLLLQYSLITTSNQFT